MPRFTIDTSASVVDLTRMLCDIPSESGHERDVADAIEHALDRERHLTITRDGDTVVAQTHFGRSQRVIIAGHLDTVPINHNLPVTEAPDPVTGEPMLWGRGTVDMKAGVAVQVKLARDLADPAVDLTWLWYDHEEVESHLNGLGRTLRNHPQLARADFAILGEPTNGTVEGGCNGTLRARISMRGVRAHSARSWTGVNAIQRAAPILARLQDFQPERIEIDGLEYREGLNAVRISGGVAGNVIPDRCDVTVNYRFAPSKSREDAAAFIHDFFADADEIEIEDVASGALPGLEAPLASRFVEAVAKPPLAKQGWTDVSRFSALGIPAVNFGPGDPTLAHTDDERVSPAQIEHCADALRAWLSHAG